MDGEVDPEHGKRFEIAGVAERADIDRAEAGGGDERFDGALGGGVVAAKETIGALSVEVRVAEQGGADRVKCLDEESAGMERLKIRSAPP